jgi:sec-independent protein translocase protein TatB
MDILGVGPMELFFVVILALIILGPKDMQKAGRSMGRWLNNLVRSDTWKMVRQASNKIKYLPNELMREAGMEDIKNASQDLNNEINNEINNKIPQELMDPFKSWKGPISFSSDTPKIEKSPISENVIEPPRPDSNNGGDNGA